MRSLIECCKNLSEPCHSFRHQLSGTTAGLTFERTTTPCKLLRSSSRTEIIASETNKWELWWSDKVYGASWKEHALAFAGQIYLVDGERLLRFTSPQATELSTSARGGDVKPMSLEGESAFMRGAMAAMASKRQTW